MWEVRTMNRMISFGYGYKDGKLIVVESEAEIVKSIFTDYINGKILKEIADELTIKGIDFFNGKCCWNKNMVFRIIENKKYIGEDGYPEIISFEQYEAANVRKGRKANRKTSLPRETEELKKYVFCGQCGRLLHRRTKWRTREKWYCQNGCKCDKYIDDSVIYTAVEKAGEKISCDPTVLTADETCTYKRTQEIMRYSNEIARLTASPSPSFKAGKKLILECASLKFQACRENKGASYTNRILQLTKNKKYDIDYISDVVSKIIVEKDGTATVAMINGAKISNREVNDAGTSEKSCNEDRCQSDSCQAE